MPNDLREALRPVRHLVDQGELGKADTLVCGLVHAGLTPRELAATLGTARCAALRRYVLRRARGGARARR